MRGGVCPPFTPIADRLERVRRTIRMHRRSCARDATGADPLAGSCDSFADALANCALDFLRRLVVGPGPGATLLRLALKRCVPPTCRWCDLQHVADFRRAIDSTLSTATGSPLGAPTPCAVRTARPCRRPQSQRRLVRTLELCFNEWCLIHPLALGLFLGVYTLTSQKRLLRLFIRDRLVSFRGQLVSFRDRLVSFRKRRRT